MDREQGDYPPPPPAYLFPFRCCDFLNELSWQWLEWSYSVVGPADTYLEANSNCACLGGIRSESDPSKRHTHVRWLTE